MNHPSRQIDPVALLARAPAIVAAISHSWLVLFLAVNLERSEHRNPALDVMPIATAMGLAAVMVTGLGTYGRIIAELLDVRRPRNPRNPKPSEGQDQSQAWRQRRRAMILAMLCLFVGLGGSAFFGTMTSVLALGVAAMLLAYYAVGRYLPAAATLIAPAITALTMLLVNPLAGFIWPIWWVFTHEAAARATVYPLGLRRPVMRGHDAWLVLYGLLFGAMLAVVWARWQSPAWPETMSQLWIGPCALAVGFAAMVFRFVRHVPTRVSQRRQRAASLEQWAILWTILYDAAWLMGSELYGQAGLCLLLFALAWLAMQIHAQLRLHQIAVGFRLPHH